MRIARLVTLAATLICVTHARANATVVQEVPSGCSEIVPGHYYCQFDGPMECTLASMEAYCSFVATWFYLAYEGAACYNGGQDGAACYLGNN